MVKVASFRETASVNARSDFCKVWRWTNRGWGWWAILNTAQGGKHCHRLCVRLCPPKAEWLKHKKSLKDGSTTSISGTLSATVFFKFLENTWRPYHWWLIIGRLLIAVISWRTHVPWSNLAILIAWRRDIGIQWGSHVLVTSKYASGTSQRGSFEVALCWLEVWDQRRNMEIEVSTSMTLFKAWVGWS